MREPAPFRLCLIGLPATGKTTYIAALWAYLTSGLPEGGYRVSEFPDDPSYLNEIAAAWAAGKGMPRNSLGATDRIEFTIETPSGTNLTIVLPDLPGEVFRNAIIRPMMDEDSAAAVVSSDLLMLFVNGETARTYAALGDHQVPEIEVNVADESRAIPTSEPNEPGESSVDRNTGTSREFAIEDLDSDTLNTELLHRLIYLTREVGLPPLAVVVSAWDAHHCSGDSPAVWLAREQPMLSQAIEEIGRSVAVGVVGVSGQGANYKDDPTITRKLASERPWGCDASGAVTDIAGPLVWHDSLTSKI
jgi:hypothetical protein